MKRLSFMMVALFIGTMAFAQKTDQAIDQYGNKVDVKEVTASDRDGILVFESKDKDYKFWFDSGVGRPHRQRRQHPPRPLRRQDTNHPRLVR